MTRYGRPLILCYHAVSDAWTSQLSVPPAALERQLELLLRIGYRPATAAQTVAGRGRLLHVTFDDAYANVTAALPALERLRIPVTVFACTSYADDGRALRVPELAHEFEAHSAELKTMTWDVLRELTDRGVEVGSHTVSHPHLPDIGDEELARELTQSRERISDELGSPCRLVAYPYGENDVRVRSAAQAAGYEAAFGLPGDMSWSERFDLPRTGIWRGEGFQRVLLKTSRLARTSTAVRLLRGHV